MKGSTVTEEEKQIEDELPASFTDERGREWNIRLPVPVVYAFCREHKIKLDELIAADEHDVSILLDLAFYGTRYQARAKGQSKSEFLDALEGPSFLAAIGAAGNALLNFSLKWIPKADRAEKLAEMKRLMAAAGVGATSSGSAASPESTHSMTS